VNLPSATVLYDVFLILAVQIVCSTVATLHGCNSNFFTIELKLYKSMTESVIIRHFFSKFLCLICVTLYPIECNSCVKEFYVLLDTFTTVQKNYTFVNLIFYKSHVIFFHLVT